MKRHFLLLCLLSTSIFVSAQVKDLGGPISLKMNMMNPIDYVQMPAFDLKSLQREDSINDSQKIGPWRFGYLHDVDLGIDKDGTWSDLPGGDRVWRIGIYAPNAVSLNVIFDEFLLPENAHIYMYTPEGRHIIGAFTAANNNEEQTLGSEILPGEHIIIEYYEPLEARGEGKVNIGHVNHGYRKLGTYASGLMRGFDDSGDCNIDVNCPLGAGRADQINSVAMIIVGGNGVCSGALINNSCNDGAPYFLTADHCLSGASAPSTMTWAFRFNWQAPIGGTSCATSAVSVDPGTYDQTSYGANIVANHANSDFALLEINLTVADALAWGCYYAGWDKSDVYTGLDVVGIHHPSGDLKKICSASNGISAEVWGGAKTWKVDEWGNGVTEPGSSGSPLFDANGRIIGQLYGGNAACNGTVNNGLDDFYGRFGASWDDMPGIENRLDVWLNPCGTTADYIEGWHPAASTNTDDAGIQFVIEPQDKVCNETTIEPQVMLKNFGTNALTGVTIEYEVDANGIQTSTGVETCPVEIL